MKYDEAWEIYRSRPEDGAQASAEEWFLVDEAIDYLLADACPEDKFVWIFNKAMNYYDWGYKELALKYLEYGIAQDDDSLCYSEAGAMCFSGDGVPVDYEKAFRYLNAAYHKHWYQKADLLAEMYEKGLYVEKDAEKAEEIFDRYYKYRMLNEL